MLASILIIVAGMTGTSFADVAQTPNQRATGDATFTKAGLNISGKPVTWQDIITFCRQQPLPLHFPSSMVHFANGDRLGVKILDLRGDSLSVVSSLVGRRTFRLTQLAAMELVAGSIPIGATEKGILYREDGEPVPGPILWMDTKQIAIESPLGVLTIKRPMASAYVFDPEALKQARSTSKPASASAPAAEAKPAVLAAENEFVGEFEVALVDGSLLRGKVAPKDAGLVLDHNLLNHVSIPYSAVLSIVRYQPSIVHLKDLKFDVQAKPVLVKAPTVEKLQYYRGLKGKTFLCLSGLACQPETTIRYKLEKSGNRKIVATVQPVPGARGDSHVKISSGGTAVFEQDIVAGSEPTAINADLTDSDELTIEVSLPAKPAYPCGVILGDAAVVLK